MITPIVIGEWQINLPDYGAFYEYHLTASSIHGTVVTFKNGEAILSGSIKDDYINLIKEWNRSDAKKFLTAHHALTKAPPISLEGLPHQEERAKFFNVK